MGQRVFLNVNARPILVHISTHFQKINPSSFPALSVEKIPFL
jgi:hypothetical protein